ncbi:MAG: ATP-dependent DNA helicase RecG [Planctomycetes bacterium]|nr:ATP-dependent DNA helicase RecG [Planctomycetota bacterium]
MKRTADVQLVGPESPLTALAGIGPARAKRFEALGVRTLRELCTLLPRKLEPWPAPTPIASARESLGARVVLSGRVERSRFSRFGARSLVRVTLGDESGSIDVLFFNQSWLRERFAKGDALDVEGKVTDTKGPVLVAGRLATPERPFPAPGTLVATYPSADGLAAGFVADACRRASELVAAELVEPLEPRWLAARELPELSAAVRALHAPRDLADFARARTRIALEPLLELEARIVTRSRAARELDAPAIEVADAEVARLVHALGHQPTGDQRRALETLRGELAQARPMRRLLQGDVGSGKTLVAAFACALVARAGAQAALLAPTEILAEQHRASLADFFAKLGIETELVIGSLSPAERRRAGARLASGAARIAFGTHALLSESLEFQSLALAVIDEQHRFGVAQRGKLAAKGRGVHVLLLTATPIPRTLALALYGDLEVSTLREKPAGRGRTITRWMQAGERAELRKLLRERLDAGERAYWVVPRIDQPVQGQGGQVAAGGVDDQRGAEKRFELFARSEFARFGVELVHGRLERDERARRLARFRSGESRLLVATTVIEVGVDVPEATVLVVEEAERLGLAQLHQLRGRVGRGARDAHCFLLGKPIAAERFRLLERERDGFAIAEADLAARGMGDLVGVRQSGENAEGLGTFGEELELLYVAREWVSASEKVRLAYLRGASAVGSI